MTRPVVERMLALSEMRAADSGRPSRLALRWMISGASAETVSSAAKRIAASRGKYILAIVPVGAQVVECRVLAAAEA